MKTTVQVLLDALTRAQKGVRARRAGVTIESHADGSASIHASQQGGGRAKAVIPSTDLIGFGSGFKITVNGDQIVGALSQGDPKSDVTLTKQDGADCIRMRFGQFNLRFANMAQTDPFLIAEGDWKHCKPLADGVPGQDLRNAFGRVAFAAARNDPRPYMNGVLLQSMEGKLSMIATDGRMLAAFRSGIPSLAGDMKMILPIEIAEALQSVLRSDEQVSLYAVDARENSTDDTFRPTSLGLRTSTFEMLCPLFDGVFPDWERLIKGIQVKYAYAVPRADMEVATRVMKVAGQVGDPESNRQEIVYVRLEENLERNTFSLQSLDSENVAHIDIVSKEGEANATSISFTNAFLNQMVGAARGDTLRMFVGESGSVPGHGRAALFRDGEDTEWVGLLAPASV
jgi:DNA polymerase III sliding clamp (beta) subunit (PCNA family)